MQVRIGTHERTAVATRICVTAAGLVLVGMGIGLAKVSTTGVAPFSCPAAVCSYITEAAGTTFFTMGRLAFLISSLCFFVELALLKRAFNPWQIMQIPALMLMTASIDFWIAMFSWIDVGGLWVRMSLLGASILILSLGIHLEVFANVIMIPGDAMVACFSYVLKKPYSKIKVVVDCTFASIGLALSLIWFGDVRGIGVGTVASALLVGTCIKMWSAVLSPVESRLDVSGGSVLPSVVPRTY